MSKLQSRPNTADTGFQRLAWLSGMYDSAVLVKLLVFATLVAVAPIATYFGTIDRFWNGSSTWAAISAVVAANMVLIGYVVVAFREDVGPPGQPSMNSKPVVASKKQQ